MLAKKSVLKVAALAKNPQPPLISRTFITQAVITGLASHFIFGKDAQLADNIENGKYSNPSTKSNDTTSIDLFKRPMEPQYDGHVPLYLHEKFLMYLVSSAKSYYHPEDGINIVQLGESTAIPCCLENLKQIMLKDDVGRRILRERPNISSETLEAFRGSNLPPNSVGMTYFKWLDKEGVGPDTRAPVQYIDDPDHAYIFKRYRQCHDFYHAINDLPINIEGEITVKCLEACNIGIPMAIMGSIFAPFRLKKAQKERLYDIYLPWAVKQGLNSKPLINVYWEEIMHKDVNEVRESLGISKPPDLRALRKEQRRLRKELKIRYER
ncbi:probable Ubiquinone biosynthesis protein COQ4, mitochondrial [Saccharomycodes ludwigii]|uniref:4-hydroxy-3-methoxy-5-polyprenylbenzoate decarboxylase n=1 Tax=Saccharomycodes ludwigii TaxID=36035 RepID=A0A376B0Y1_9ASCO|nr:hypothetical protein SCDLUD_001882 [Saccharomycodes ludwigii]KAH3902071.1 hypothetical protein SCDLUD_001882 [Saccharomycodes ludwigii]SSD58302.1 probable Ubiquinone biosynthesis protein COQ4, mitochondrial [Saccharomycodes ludwigii]